ncbi:MAG: type I restriction endonuclease subunit R [Acidobacteriota bacterium]|nr:type I restriction endonuclease subunit R [Acidobacteriota bacterium]
MPNFISENDIEGEILKKLKDDFSFELLNCYTKDAEDLNDRSGRSDKRDVILADRLRESLVRLNPHLPAEAIEKALDSLTNKRQAMSAINANRELDGLIRNGVPVQYQNEEGRTEQEQVRVIDFDNSGRNRFLAVSQLWIKGDKGFRRPDILIYINGLPLVFIELKNSNVKLKSAFDDNLTTYKDYIPQLFLTNAFCILSNGIETKFGSFTAGWEYFFNWLRIEDEKEKVDRKKIEREGTSIEYVIKGLLDPKKLLDYVENYIIYNKLTQKIIAQNHQFLGVNNAFESFKSKDENKGRLGVFWHTQGSGKSFSMIYLVRKIFRKLTGNFTFVVITDRNDLDGQIYRNFLQTETVKESDAAQPKNSEEMRRFLGQNKRLVFTLIHKFRYDRGEEYPVLSDRNDIIVIVDEAHRTQYKSLAENMRKGLPNANYIAFTGTPLLGRERKTNAWFGEYVSEYNFQQSMDDGATVPLYYQKRVPEMQNQNEELSDEFYELLDEENLDDAQQAKLENYFATEAQIIKRDDRLETIAEDVVKHFPNRGYLGKGIFVAVDKFTAVKMYDKVQRFWKEEIKQLRGKIRNAESEIHKGRLQKQLDYMKRVEMVVVISQEAGEEEKFQKETLDIKPHRKRMDEIDENGHDVEHNFKDEEHPLQIVFVCAMWLTGFDAPTVSTLYLDKPMKDHTLMQTIARANRVTPYKINDVVKTNGEIVDYYNVTDRLKKALKDYAQGEEGTEPLPLKEKSELFKLLDNAIKEGLTFCQSKDFDLAEVLGSKEVFKNLELFKNYANVLLEKDEDRKTFNVYENTITSLYEASKPEILGKPSVKIVAAFQYLRGVIESIIEQKDISEISTKIGELLDESVVVDDADQFKSKEFKPEFEIVQRGQVWDLSTIDFEELKKDFGNTKYKNIQIADLRSFIERKVEQMLKQNLTRADFAQRLQTIIDRYNAGSSAIENYYQDLVDFAEDIKEEDERHVREGLTEDELEFFDLLKKEKMTKDEEQKVKLAAKSLLSRLREEHPRVLVQNWHLDSQSKTQVSSVVESVLHNNLPESYDRRIFKEKCDIVFDTMIDYANRGIKYAV